MSSENLANLSRSAIVLEGEHVRLEPLTIDHAPDLYVASQDDDIWRGLTNVRPTTLADMQAILEMRLSRQAAGHEYNFAVVHRPTAVAIGMTRIHDYLPEHGSIEIGGTWYASAHQRTAVNSECKYLLLRHAFESLDCVRVCFTAYADNERSQRALERIGAVREGVLRKYRWVPKHSEHRSMVLYSILDDEWPTVKARLEAMLVR